MKISTLNILIVTFILLFSICRNSQSFAQNSTAIKTIRIFDAQIDVPSNWKIIRDIPVDSPAWTDKNGLKHPATILSRVNDSIVIIAQKDTIVFCNFIQWKAIPIEMLYADTSFLENCEGGVTYTIIDTAAIKMNQRWRRYNDSLHKANPFMLTSCEKTYWSRDSVELSGLIPCHTQPAQINLNCSKKGMTGFAVISSPVYPARAEEIMKVLLTMHRAN